MPKKSERKVDARPAGSRTASLPFDASPGARPGPTSADVAGSPLAHLSAASHGSPFPLLLRPANNSERKELPRYLKRRLGRRDCVEFLIADAVSALNALHGARANMPLDPQQARRAKTDSELGAVRSSCLNVIGRCASLALPRPVERSLFQDGALCELLRAKDMYDPDVHAGSAPYDASRLKVLRGGSVPKDAQALVGDRARIFLEDPDKYIVRPPYGFLQLPPPIKPH